jgi:glycosyltransferase involved in cell wall biosynthesis
MTKPWISENGTAHLVSVIIPTYNRSALLKEAVMSVYAQNYRPIECIIADDGSTDDTADTVKELQQLNSEDFQLYYIVQPNAGAQVARNNGTKQSKGEYIQYLDSDDLLYEGKLSNQVYYLQQHKQCNGVYGDWRKGTAVTNELIEAKAGGDLTEEFLTGRCVANFSFIMRRSLIAAIGPWDVGVKRNQEIDYHLRGLLLNAQYDYLPGITGLWREHEGERIFSKTNFSNVIAFYRKWEMQLQQKNKWNGSLQRGIVNNYVWYLSNYMKEEAGELLKLLKEMNRLYPQHPIFISLKFKVFKKILGFDKAALLWIKRYKGSNRTETAS